MALCLKLVTCDGAAELYVGGGGSVGDFEKSPNNEGGC